MMSNPVSEMIDVPYNALNIWSGVCCWAERQNLAKVDLPQWTVVVGPE
jgi:hypothetical protein